MRARKVVPSILLATAMVLGTGWHVVASGPPEGRTLTAEDMQRKRIDMRLRDMSANLGLTPEQQQELRPILEREANELRLLRVDASISETERQDRYETIRQSYRSQIERVLTPDQIAKMEEARQRRQAMATESFSQKRKGKLVVRDEE